MSKLHATIQAYGSTDQDLITALEKALIAVKSGSLYGVYCDHSSGYKFNSGEELHTFTTAECQTLHTAMCETVNRINESPEGYEDEHSEESDRDVLAKVELAAGR